MQSQVEVAQMQAHRMIDACTCTSCVTISAFIPIDRHTKTHTQTSTHTHVDTQTHASKLEDTFKWLHTLQQTTSYEQSLQNTQSNSCSNAITMCCWRKWATDATAHAVADCQTDCLHANMALRRTKVVALTSFMAMSEQVALEHVVHAHGL